MGEHPLTRPVPFLVLTSPFKDVQGVARGMRDFDVVRAEREGIDREFRIGGEEFRCRAFVAPQPFMEIFESLSKGDREFWGTLDAVYPTEILEPGFEDQWARLRDRKNTRAPSVRDMIDVTNFVTEVISGRPTVPSTVSSDTSPINGTGSTGKPRSKAQTSVPSTSGVS